MITLWNTHNDAYKRISYFLGDHIYYGGTTVPNFKYLIVSEGPWLKDIPKEKFSKVLGFPCLKPSFFSQIRGLGFKNIIAQDSVQEEAWGKNEAVSIPVYIDKIYEPQKRTQLICSIVNEYEKRNYFCYQMNKRLKIPNYGTPDNYHPNIIDLLSSTKFLFHPKNIGYLCNVVLQAMQTLTPVIFTEESYRHGYTDFLTRNENCIVLRNENHLKKVLEMDDLKYQKLQENIALSVKKIQSTYSEGKVKLKNFIQKIWPETNLKNSKIKLL